MNLRALALLFAFLLMQAGSGMAMARCQSVAEHATVSCLHGCCEQPMAGTGLSEAGGCACLQSAPQEQEPVSSVPVPPVSQGRDLVPQVLWLTEVLLDFMNPTATWANSEWRSGAPCDVRAPLTVPLQVLHCAFLI